MRADVPHCTGSFVSVSDGTAEIQYLRNQHLYVGCFYLVFFIVAIIPQFFLFYTCLEKKAMSQSCYKLMTIVCVCDMVNLFNCLCVAGIFSIFRIQHCRTGLWIVYYGQFVMFFWYAYCIANLILAVNRLLEFLDKEFSNLLFRGNRSYLWIVVVALYAGLLCVLSPRPFYFYDPNAGVWYFFWLGKQSTNYFHIYNNMGKLALVIVCYGLMLVVLRKNLKQSSHMVSIFEKKLSIQACLIAVACAAGNITYVVISYMPMGNSPISGTFGEFFWGVQHSAAGFVYLAMNYSVRRNVNRFIKSCACSSSTVQIARTVGSNKSYEVS